MTLDRIIREEYTAALEKIGTEYAVVIGNDITWFGSELEAKKRFAKL